MENTRKDRVYQTLVTDLVLAGVITKELGERLLGCKVPNYLRLPKENTALATALNKVAAKKTEVKADKTEVKADKKVEKTEE